MCWPAPCTICAANRQSRPQTAQWLRTLASLMVAQATSAGRGPGIHSLVTRRRGRTHELDRKRADSGLVEAKEWAALSSLAASISTPSAANVMGLRPTRVSVLSLPDAIKALNDHRTNKHAGVLADSLRKWCTERASTQQL